MTSLVTENVVLTTANNAALGPSPETVEATNGVFTNVTVDTINGGAIVGAVVTVGGAQTITGVKTFSATPLMDAIDEATAGFGVTIDNVRIMESTISGDPVAAFEPIGADTNIGVVIMPKGNGAIRADSLGDARGAYATDFQRSRAANANAATGDYTVIGGGISNTASNTYACVIGGNTNTASGISSTVIGGAENTASATMTVVLGGSLNESTAAYAVSGGRRAKATHLGAHIIADSTDADFVSTTSDQWAGRFAGGYRLTGGAVTFHDASGPVGSATVTTTDATPTDLHSVVVLPDRVYIFTARVVCASTPDAAVFRQSVMVKTPGAVITVSAAFDDWSVIDPALAGISISFSTSGINVVLGVTGIAATTINWTSVIDIAYGDM